MTGPASMPALARVTILQHGFFAPTATIPLQGARVVHTDGLTEPLSFAKVAVAAAGLPETRYLLVHAFPILPIGKTRERLEMVASARFPGSALYFSLPQSHGLPAGATVGLERPHPPFGALAALAVTQYSLAWEEADPIVISYPGGQAALSPAFIEGSWTVQVQ